MLPDLRFFQLTPAFRTDPVRHMSVRSPGRAGETTDRHGQPPCKPCYQHVHLITGPGWACHGRRQSRDDPAPQSRANVYAERFVLNSPGRGTDQMLIFSDRRLHSILLSTGAQNRDP